MVNKTKLAKDVVNKTPMGAKLKLLKVIIILLIVTFYFTCLSYFDVRCE